MMKHQISRHYITIKGLQIHYRKAGAGRPIILFHQSPRSSAEYEELIKEWADEFTVIAPDTPGFGYSDPLLKEKPTMMDFAQIMAEFIKSLGLGKVGIYGFHTGASLGVCVASLIPDNIAIAILHGLAKLFPEEKKEFLSNYFPPIDPEWDGSHLTWLWARIREQSLFFPWYKKDDDHRLPMNIYSPEKMEAQLQDFLLSGDEYRKAYGAAFSLDPESLLKTMKAPLKIIAAPPDPLFVHLNRLKVYSDACQIVAFDDPDRAICAAFDFLNDADYGSPVNRDICNEVPVVSGRNFVTLEGNRVHIKDVGKDRALPALIILPDLMGSISALDDDIMFLSKYRRVIAIDLPAHGGADPLSDIKNRVLESVSNVISQVIKEINAQECEILTHGFSAFIARSVKKNLGNVKSITSIDLLLPKPDKGADIGGQLLPDMAANDWGGHLLSGWYFLRCKQLFWPWYAPDKNNIIKGGRAQEAAQIQREFVALWQSDQLLVRVILEEIFSSMNKSGQSIFEDCDHLLLPEWCRDRQDIQLPARQVEFYTSNYKQKLKTAFCQSTGDYHV